VSDLEALAHDTHKFEARYLGNLIFYFSNIVDSLVGEYPAQKDIYVKRSPINHIEGFDAPLAIFQGDEDVIVPPNQAEVIYQKLKSKGYDNNNTFLTFFKVYLLPMCCSKVSNMVSEKLKTFDVRWMASSTFTPRCSDLQQPITWKVSLRLRT
jgi:hypothetical protein